MWRSAGGGAEAKENSVELLCFAEQKESRRKKKKREKRESEEKELGLGPFIIKGWMAQIKRKGTNG